MEEIKKNETESVKNEALKPSTKDALKAENEALKAELEALKAATAKAPTGEAAPNTGTRMVKVKIPRTKKDEEDVFVSVNNYTCIIKRGVEVEVPDFVYEVLCHQEEMLEKIMLFEEAARSKDKDK